MQEVDSSKFARLGFNPATNELIEEYKSGDQYARPCTREEFDQLLSAESIGKHHHANLADHARDAELKARKLAEHERHP